MKPIRVWMGDKRVAGVLAGAAILLIVLFFVLRRFA